MTTSAEEVVCELEALTGKVYRGDVTAVVFDILKDTPHLDHLLAYLSEEKLVNVRDNKPNTTVREEDSDRPCFEKWITRCKRL